MSTPNESHPGAGQISELRQSYERQLLKLVVPFWNRYGVDQAYGGFLCHLDYDGTLIDERKPLWYQGRGLWVYSRLADRVLDREQVLATARAARDFLLDRVKPEQGGWPEVVSREGEILVPYRGDSYGMYFAAEGLAEYAWASADERSLEVAAELMRSLIHRIHDPQPHVPGLAPGLRPQGLWMCCLQIATPWKRCWPGDWMGAIAADALDAVLNRHYDPELGLNREILRVDGSCPEEYRNYCVVGHSIECLWMTLDEAERSGRHDLFPVIAERIKQHLDCGWDPEYGGIADSILVGAHGHEWIVEPMPGSTLAYRFRGEYNWRKTYWSINEAIIAVLKVYTLTRAAWAWDYFLRLNAITDQHFSLASKGLGSHVLVTDRDFEGPARSTRQDNYHPFRRLIYGLDLLEQLEAELTDEA